MADFLNRTLCLVGLGFMLVAPCFRATAQPAANPDVPLPSLNNGAFVHGPEVTTKLVSVGSDGIILECQTEHPLMLWREHFVAIGSSIKLDAILRPIVVSTEPYQVQWVEARVDAISSRIDPRHPQPPKVLSIHSRPAIFTENKFGTANIGPTSVDARWSNYGEYLQRTIENVQIEWDRILESGQPWPPKGTKVSVKFRLDSKGRIAEIIDVNSTSSEQGRAACVSAITNRSPYGEWTPDMVALLGDSQDMTFTFYYQ